jgi:hypothetical protein
VALSYYWGDATSTTYPLVCLSYVIPIRQNLHDALVQLNQVKCQDWLWIDAVCIARDNNHEKNKQIPLMKEIYRKAKLVLAWLGTARVGFGGAWEYMERLPDILEGVDYTPPPAPLDWQGMSEPPADFWHRVKDFVGRPYFSRLWIAQEIALAQSVSVLCGQFLFSWKELVPVVDTIFGNEQLVYMDWAEYLTMFQLIQSTAQFKAIKLTRNQCL